MRRKQREFCADPVFGDDPFWGRKKQVLETVVFEGTVAVRETVKALWCETHGRFLWVPKSQIEKTSQVQHAGDHGELEVSAWITTQPSFDAVMGRGAPDPAEESENADE